MSHWWTAQLSVQMFNVVFPGSWVITIHMACSSAQWLLHPSPSSNHIILVEGWYVMARHLLGFPLLDPPVYQVSFGIRYFSSCVLMGLFSGRVTIISLGVSLWYITRLSIFCSEDDDNLGYFSFFPIWESTLFHIRDPAWLWQKKKKFLHGSLKLPVPSGW